MATRKRKVKVPKKALPHLRRRGKCVQNPVNGNWYLPTGEKTANARRVAGAQY